MVDHGQQLPKTFFRFIGHFLSQFKGVVLIYVLLGLCTGLRGPFSSILIKKMINLLPQVQSGDVSILFMPATLIILNFIIFDNLTWRGMTYIRAKFTPVIMNRMIGASMEYVLGHSHQFFQDHLSGKISKQITNLADETENLIILIAPGILRGVSLLLASLIATYFVHPIFFLILVTWFVFFVGVSLFMSKKFVALSDAQATAESSIVGELVDTISNQMNVRLFSKKSYEQIRMQPYFMQQQKSYRKTYLYVLMKHSIQGGLIALMMAFSVYFLVKLYGKNLVTTGDFALIFGLSMEVGHMTWYTMWQFDNLNKAMGKCKQSLSALMNPLEITDKAGAKDLECSHGKIQFSDVEFRYKGSETLFKNKSITIHSGQKIGLVGYSGGGKSSFVNLIMRLYDVTDGCIMIDGKNIRDVTQDSLRENIAVIPQDPSLFHRTIMENIRYGRINATDEEVIEATKKAHAHDFITCLADGYNSLVGERGIKLSGGQRQRIAIARAIVKNAPILILDEATSQLDSVTEALIQESLWTLMQNKTTIVIAHRLSTLLHMDRILVFEGGNIVEDGSHSDLLLKNNLYKKLWDAQVGGFLGGNAKKVSDIE